MLQKHDVRICFMFTLWQPLLLTVVSKPNYSIIKCCSYSILQLSTYNSMDVRYLINFKFSAFSSTGVFSNSGADIFRTKLVLKFLEQNLFQIRKKIPN